jgi:hypothetical protein
MSVLSWFGYSSEAEREEGSALVALVGVTGASAAEPSFECGTPGGFLTAGSRV